MLFFYLRHGDPIYDPDSLTYLGEKQAEALSKRLALYGIDKIYASTSNRALQTAQPTANILKKTITPLDFANEGHAWNDFTVKNDDGSVTWLFHSEKTKKLFAESSMFELGFDWYRHKELEQYDYKKGVDRIYDESDKFLLSLGYEHIRRTGKYKVIKSNSERVALFAHQGFGIAFLSCLLDIPYPIFANHFDICHTGMTVIDFRERGGFSIPKILTFSSDSHLYRDGICTNYNGEIKF